MTEIQDLLNIEAELSNSRFAVVKQIKVLRGEEPPVCWGMDDCSTTIMSQCPWRIDCDGYEAINWQETHPW